MFIPFFTKLAASLQAKNNKKYIQLLTRLYGGKDTMYTKLKNIHDSYRGLFHGTSLDAAEKIDKTGLKPFDGAYGKGVYFGDKLKASQPAYFRGAMYKLKGPNQMTQDGQEYIDPRLMFSHHKFLRVPSARSAHRTIQRKLNEKNIDARRKTYGIDLASKAYWPAHDFLKDNPHIHADMMSGNGAISYEKFKKSNPNLSILGSYDEYITEFNSAKNSKPGVSNNDAHYSAMDRLIGISANRESKKVHGNKLRRIDYSNNDRAFDMGVTNPIPHERVLRSHYLGSEHPSIQKFTHQKNQYEVNTPKAIPIEHLQRFV